MNALVEIQLHIKIKKIRELKNLTREYMAGELCIEPRTYSYIEEGKTSLTLNRMVDISNVFKCTIQDILDFNPSHILNFNVNLENGNSGNTINYQNINNEKNLYIALIKSKDEMIFNLEQEIKRLKSMDLQ